MQTPSLPRKTARAVAGCAVLAATLAALAARADAAPRQPAAGSPRRLPDEQAAVALVIEGSNAFRAANGLAPVRPEAALTAAARRFADYLSRSAEFSHVADGRQPSQRAVAQGYAPCLVAENIAFEGSSVGFTTGELADDFVQGWIHSPGHRRNLLDADATQTGVAIAHVAGTDRWYAVQMFGRPASLRITFEVANRSRETWRYSLGDQSWNLAPGVRQTHGLCVDRTLQVELPGPEGATRLQPRDGAHYRIEDTPQGPRLSAG